MRGSDTLGAMRPSYKEYFGCTKGIHVRGTDHKDRVASVLRLLQHGPVHEIRLMDGQKHAASVSG